jgi:myo-inositol-1(or 4)-monophosphatase
MSLMPSQDSPLPDTQFYSLLLRVAETAARDAGRVALEGYRGPLEILSKGGKDIVTQYDTAAEWAALAVIKSHFPDHAILAEESGHSEGGEAPGARRASARWLWAIDPIDGTHNYASQLPFWCVSIAVADADLGRVVAGVVFDPVHDELFSASLGGGAFLNGTTLRVSEKQALEAAFVAMDVGFDPGVAATMLALVPWVQPRVQRLRLLGAAVLGLAYVAAGRFHAYYHLSLNLWDFAAASLLIREAGGTITGWSGEDLPAARSGVVASNPALHPQMLELLQQGLQHITVSTNQND